MPYDAQHDEDELERLLAEQQAAEPASLPADAVAQAAPPTGQAQQDFGPSPMWEKFANQQAHMTPGSGPSALHTLATRGQSSGSSGADVGRTAGLGLAAFLDLALNRGRNTGALLGTMAAGSDPYEQQMRDLEMQHKQAQIEALGRRGRERLQPRPIDPRLQEYRERSIKLREDQFAASQAEKDRKAKEAEALKRLDSAETQSLRDAAVATGVDPEAVASMTGEQIMQWRPQLGQMAQQLRSDTSWQQRFGKTQAAQIAKEGREEERDLAKEGRADERELAKEGRDREAREQERAATFASEFAKTHQTDLDIAGLIQDIENSPGGVPPSFFERFRSSLTARGIDPDRLEPWQAKQMVLELWSRKQTGANIATDEDAKFVSQVGMDPAASPEQIEAAYRVLGRVVGRRLKRVAVANPNAARDVAAAGGLDADRWIGKPAQTKKPRAQAKPKAETMDVIGTRKGKPVVAIKRGSLPDGRRGRMIFYQDGTREVVADE